MAWDEIGKGSGRGFFRHEPGKFYLSVNTMGVRLILPNDHALTKSPRVRVFFGKGEDAGWMMLVASTNEDHRVVVKSQTRKTKSQSFHVGFSTLPGIEKGFRLSPTVVEHKENSSGHVMIRLPWAKPLGVTNCGFRKELTDAKLRYSPKPGKDRETIDEFLARGNVSLVMGLEQAADFLCQSGHRCFIRIGAAGPDQPVLDGAEVTVRELFRVVNEYRKAGSLAPVNPPPERVAA